MPERRRRIISVVVTTISWTLLANLALVILAFGTVNPLGGFWGDHFPTSVPVTRARKVKLFEAWDRRGPVQGLILGSSKSMKLEPSVFSRATGLRYFNFSLSAGMLEDVGPVMSFVEDQKAPVREMTLALDPQMFTGYNVPAELKDDWELAPRLEGRAPTFGWKVAHVADLLKEALSVSYANQVGISIMAAVRHKEPLHYFHADGYLEYRTRDRLIAAGRYNRAGAIAECADSFVDSLVKIHSFDPRQIALLDSILDRAHAHGIRVVLWITPGHPDLFARIAQHPEVAAFFRALPDTIRRIAAAHDVPVVNLQTIDLFGGDPDDFYDCVHFGAKNAALVTERLLAARQPPVAMAGRADSSSVP